MKDNKKVMMTCTYVSINSVGPYVYVSAIRRYALSRTFRSSLAYYYKNSSGDEITNVNFYAVRPEATRIH